MIDPQDKRIIKGLLLFQFFAVIYFIYFFLENRYLPSPFFYDKSDSFMDFYNPLYWSDREGAYSYWGSVYPPINFLLLEFIKVVFVSADYQNANALRQESSFLVYMYLGFSLISVLFVLISPAWKCVSKYEKITIFALFVLSVPFLFTLERGNLITFSIGFIAWIIISREEISTRFISVLVNIKPYFILLALAPLFKKDASRLIKIFFWSASIFISTAFLTGDESILFFKNIINFSQSSSQSALEILSMPSSISAISCALKLNYWFLGEDITDLLFIFIEIVKWSAILLLLFACYKNRRLIPYDNMIFFMTIVISNLGIWIGGYSLLLYFPFYPIMSKLIYRKYFLIGMFFIFMPFDIISIMQQKTVPQFVYLSGIDNKSGLIQWSLGLGSILRPTVNILLVVLSSLEIYSTKKIIQDKKRK